MQFKSRSLFWSLTLAVIALFSFALSYVLLSGSYGGGSSTDSAASGSELLRKLDKLELQIQKRLDIHTADSRIDSAASIASDEDIKQVRRLDKLSDRPLL